MKNKSKLIITVIITIAISLILLITGIFGCIIVSAITIPLISQSKSNKDVILANALKTNLFIAKTEYELNQTKIPQKFSDFAILHGKIKPPYTFSFEEIGFNLIKPESKKDLETKDLHVLFNDGIEAIYHLETNEITITFIHPKIDN